MPEATGPPPSEPFALPAQALEALCCPLCAAPFAPPDAGGLRCTSCGWTADVTGGVVDLVPDAKRTEERAFYDEFYETSQERVVPDDLHELAERFTLPVAPWECRRVWDRLGNLAGKTVLLVGNGDTPKELLMLTEDPRLIIFSDLSPVGLRRFRAPLDRRATERVVFAAIDCFNLPLRDSSVDIVYGFAVVHHLGDRVPFLREAARVLRPGGRAVFMDDARSALWQHLKLRWMRPLMTYTHRKIPRSPEDMEMTFAGGFVEDELAAEIRSVGGEPYFERVAFLYYMWMRSTRSLFPKLRDLPGHARVAAALERIDRWLGRYAWYRANMIRLVWGFEKPAAGARRTRARGRQRDSVRVP